MTRSGFQFDLGGGGGTRGGEQLLSSHLRLGVPFSLAEKWAVAPFLQLGQTGDSSFSAGSRQWFGAGGAELQWHLASRFSLQLPVKAGNSGETPWDRTEGSVFYGSLGLGGEWTFLDRPNWALGLVGTGEAQRGFQTEEPVTTIATLAVRLSLGRVIQRRIVRATPPPVGPVREESPPPEEEPIIVFRPEKPQRPVKPDATEEHPARTEQLLREADDAAGRGDYEGAAQRYERLALMGAVLEKPAVLRGVEVLQKVQRFGMAQKLCEAYLGQEEDPNVRVALAVAHEYQRHFDEVVRQMESVRTSNPDQFDYTVWARLFLRKMLRKGEFYYFNDDDMADFEKEILIPYANEGRLVALRQGLDQFYQSMGLEADPNWESNLYELFILKEFLGLSLDLPAGSRYNQGEMKQRLEELFYTPAPIPGKPPMVMPKTKSGVNMYLEALLHTNQDVALPDDGLLDHLYGLGCRRASIDQLRAKIGGAGR